MVDTVNVECMSWWTKKRGNFVFLSVMTSKYSMYSVPIGNSWGLVMTLSLIVIEEEGSRSLIAMKKIYVSPEDLRNSLSQSYRIRR